VIRRITGPTLKQFVAEEIADPLGADFQIGAAEGGGLGTPHSDSSRITDLSAM
jgi:CubicO group peptidase (beta-lactamase class C family)